jgi:hypothetical protein
VHRSWEEDETAKLWADSLSNMSLPDDALEPPGADADSLAWNSSVAEQAPIKGRPYAAGEPPVQRRMQPAPQQAAGEDAWWGAPELPVPEVAAPPARPIWEPPAQRMEVPRAGERFGMARGAGRGAARGRRGQQSSSSGWTDSGRSSSGACPFF